MVSPTTTTIEEEALRLLPIALSFAEAFFPALKAINPILIQAAPSVIGGVNAVIDMTGATQPQATSAVTAHLTPGLPNSPALSPAPQQLQGPKTP